MRFWISLALLAALGSGCAGDGSMPRLVAYGAATAAGEQSQTGRYLVRFRDGIAGPEQDAALVAAGDSVIRDIGPLGVRIVQSTEAGAGLDASLVDYAEPDVPCRASPVRDARGLSVRLRVGWSPPIRDAQALQAPRPDPGVLVNDPMLAEQWGLAAIHAKQAWERTMGDPAVVVAVIDTGVDPSHPDLRGQLVAGVSFVNVVQGPSGQPGDDRVVPIHNSGPVDDNGHGTHVTGIIAAAADNGVGVAGVAPHCRVMPVKVLAYNHRGLEGDVASGVVWAVDHGARVLNMSLGGEGGSKTLERAIAYANAHGALVCAAMGNDGADPALNHGADVNYPASLPGVVAVGATTEGGQVADFSNHGTWISVAAPGEGILSTTPTYRVFESLRPNYDVQRGTSMATPFVSGTAALIWSANPSLSADQVRRRLCHGATDMLFPGFDESTGWGLIDAAAAVTDNL